MWYKYLLEEIQKIICSGYTDVFQNTEFWTYREVGDLSNLKLENFDVSNSSKSMCLIIIGDTQGGHHLFANLYVAAC